MAYIQHTMKSNGMVQNLPPPQHAVGTARHFPTNWGQLSGRWRALGYTIAFLSFLFLVFFALKDPDFNRERMSDWKSMLALAQASSDRGNLMEARSLYSRAGRMAAWQEDWTGILAAACGVHKLDKKMGPYSATRMLLLRAMTAAEKNQSRAGIAAVAKAFERTGANDASRMVLTRARPEWPRETPDSADAFEKDCG